MKQGDLVWWALDGRRDSKYHDRNRGVMGMILETQGNPAYPAGPPYDEDIPFENRYLVWWFDSRNRVKKLNMHPKHLKVLNETR